MKLLRYLHGVALMAAMAMASSCSMMSEDLPECEPEAPKTLQVKVAFKYDYNIQRADMFHDHVGSVRLFVIDADNGKVVRDLTVSNRDDNDTIKVNDNRYFTMTLSDLPLGKSYRFLAVGLQRPYDETQQRAEDKFVGTFPAVGDDADVLKMRLTRSETVDDDGCHPVTAPQCGLDTLWMGHTTEPIHLPQTLTENTVVCDTISMIRDTNYLSLTLRQLNNPTAISDDDFLVEINDANGFIAWNNDMLSDDRLKYTPHAKWTSEVLDTEGNVAYRAAHYDLSFSRLLYYKGADVLQNAGLSIYNKVNGKKVADINLPTMLAQGRNAFEIYRYSEQEYLDREYDYDMDLFLLDNEWVYLDLKVNVMAWVIRIQNETL